MTFPYEKHIEVIKRLDIPNTDVWVRQEHRIENMVYECYEYDMYFFTTDRYLVNARSYSHRLEAARFRGFRVDGEIRNLKAHHFRLQIMTAAVEYLKSVGKSELEWLDTNKSKYSPVPSRR